MGVAGGGVSTVLYPRRGEAAGERSSMAANLFNPRSPALPTVKAGIWPTRAEAGTLARARPGTKRMGDAVPGLTTM
jgi:hypothetical protein